VGFGWVGIAPTEHRQLISMVISDQIPKLSAYEEVTIQTAFFSWRTRFRVWCRLAIKSTNLSDRNMLINYAHDKIL